MTFLNPIVTGILCSERKTPPHVCATKRERGTKEMFMNCTIQISIRYPALHTELLPTEKESTEVAIEGSVCPILMELFGGSIIVDDVHIDEHPSSSYASNDEFI